MKIKLLNISNIRLDLCAPGNCSISKCPARVPKSMDRIEIRSQRPELCTFIILSARMFVKC